MMLLQLAMRLLYSIRVGLSLLAYDYVLEPLMLNDKKHIIYFFLVFSMR